MPRIPHDTAVPQQKAVYFSAIRSALLHRQTVPRRMSLSSCRPVIRKASPPCDNRPSCRRPVCAHILLPLRRILLHWPYIPPWPRKQEARSVFPMQKAPREERFLCSSDQSTNTAFLYSSGISMPRMEALVLLMMTVRSAGSCTGISCGLPLPSRMSAAISPAWSPVL